MRRTTIALEDDLFSSLKQKAAKDGVTLGSLVNRLLRRSLHAPPRGAFKFHLTTVKGHAQPAVDIDDKDALNDFLDGIKR
jgi:hypothetical protein